MRHLKKNRWDFITNRSWGQERNESWMTSGVLVKVTGEHHLLHKLLCINVSNSLSAFLKGCRHTRVTENFLEEKGKWTYKYITVGKWCSPSWKRIQEKNKAEINYKEKKWHSVIDTKISGELWNCRMGTEKYTERQPVCGAQESTLESEIPGLELLPGSISC